MAVVHWDPSRDLSLLQGDVNRLFERFFAPEQDTTSRQRWVPAMDVTEEGDFFVLRADLPGMSDADLSIEVQDRTLTLSGERRFETKPEHDGGFVRIERAYGSFERSLTLPEGADVDGIDATFDNGVLELRIPKPVEAAPRRIQIGNRHREVEAEMKEPGKRSIKDRVLDRA